MRANCPICIEESAQYLRSFARYHREQTELYRCKRCGTEFLFPMPSEDWLNFEYRDYYQRRSSGKTGSKSKFFQHLFTHLGIDFSGLEVLEVGAGDGDSVRALRVQYPQVKVTVVESHPQAKDFYASDVELVSLSIDEWLKRTEDKTYDVIMMFDLLEHLPAPLQTLEKIVNEKLSVGGRLVATFPNTDSLSRRMMGRFWFQYKVEHLVYFSRTSVHLLENKLHLKCRHLKPLTKILPLDYLFKVASEFGPAINRQLASVVFKFVPQFIRRKFLPLQLGEWLWVAQKGTNTNSQSDRFA